MGSEVNVMDVKNDLVTMSREEFSLVKDKEGWTAILVGGICMILLGLLWLRNVNRKLKEFKN